MPKDEIDAGKVLRELAELKRTLPEDEYQEIERQVLPRLAEHFKGSKPAKGKKWIFWIVGIVVMLVLLALADRIEWLIYVWYGWLALYVIATVLQVLAIIRSWLDDLMKPPGRY